MLQFLIGFILGGFGGLFVASLLIVSERTHALKKGEIMINGERYKLSSFWKNTPIIEAEYVRKTNVV